MEKTVINKIDLKKQGIISITHENVSVEDLPVIIPEGYAKLLAHLQKEGGELAAAPFVAYKNLDGKLKPIDKDNMVVELGFPLIELLPGSDEIKSYARKETQAMITTCLGSYDQLTDIYSEIVALAEKNEYILQGVAYESYLAEPDQGEDGQITMITIPFCTNKKE